MHLAEILAATEDDPEPDRGSRARTVSGTFVGMPPFPEAARTALADTPAARQPRPRHRARSAPSAPRWSPRCRTGRTLRLAGAGDQGRRPARPRRAAGAARGGADRRAARPSTGRATPPRRTRSSPTSPRRHGADEVVKVKSMATQEIELNEALAEAGHRRLGDRPRRADRPARRRPAVAHPGAGDPPQPRRDPRRSSAAEMAGGRPARARRPDRRAGRARRGGPRCTCARSSCAPRWRSPGANFAVAETGTLVVVESEGNGRMCLTLPEVLITRRRHREARADLAPTSTSSCSCCRARRPAERMNPYTSMWTGVTPGRRPAGGARGAARQRPHRALADAVGRQALRCIRCSACLNVCPVYERTGGHAYGSVYPGPDRRDPHPAAARHRRRRRRPPRCRTPRRCAAPASRSARSGSTSRRCSSTCARRSSTRTGAASPKPEAVAMQGAALGVLGRHPAAPPEGVAGRLGSLAGSVGRRRLPGGRRAPGRLPGPGAAWTGGARPARAAARSRSAPGGAAPAAGRGIGPMSAREEILGRIRTALDGRPRPSARRRRDYRSGSPTRRRWSPSSCERVADYRARRRPLRRRRRRGRTWSPSLLAGAGARRRPPGLTWLDVAGCRRRRRLHGHRARRRRRRRHRVPRCDRRDRHDRARPRGPARAAARSRLVPDLHVCVVARRPGRAPRPRGASPGSTRAARRPGSAARRPPATSSSSGSRASTARASLSLSSWARPHDRAGRLVAWCPHGLGRTVVAVRAVRGPLGRRAA